jgi:hypothetical protein
VEPTVYGAVDAVAAGVAKVVVKDGDAPVAH